MLATASHTTDSSVEKRLEVDRRPDTNRAGFGLDSGRGWSVGGGAKRDQDAPSGVHRSKGTDAVKASAAGQPEAGAGSRPAPVCSSALDGSMHFGTSACGELALRAGQPLVAIGRATGWGLRGTAQKHRGNSVVKRRALAALLRWWRGSTLFNPREDAAANGFGRQSSGNGWRPVPRVGSKTRCSGTARLAGNSGWERVSGIGGGRTRPGLGLVTCDAYRPVPPAHGGMRGLFG